MVSPANRHSLQVSRFMIDRNVRLNQRFEWLFLKDNRNFGEENFQFTLALRYLTINWFLTIALLRAIFTESVPPMSSTWMGNCKTDGRSFSRLMLCWGSRARREKFQRLEKGWSSCNKKNVPDSRLCLTRRLELTYTGYIWESEYTPGFDPMAIWTVRCYGGVMKLTLPCLPHLRWLKVAQIQRQRGRAGCVGSMSLCKKNGQTVGRLRMFVYSNTLLRYVLVWDFCKR